MLVTLSSCADDIDQIFDVDTITNILETEEVDVPVEDSEIFEEPNVNTETEEVTAVEEETEIVTAEEEETESSEEIAEVEESEVFEQEVQTPMIDGWDSLGNVDILSERFINHYLYNFSRYDFAGITRGMTTQQVESKLGEEDPYLLGYTDVISFDTRYNDLGVLFVKEDVVDSIYINPTDKVTKEEIRAYYGTPTYEYDVYEGGRGGGAFDYKMIPQSNFIVSIGFDESEHVIYMLHRLDYLNDAVSVDNAMYFVERGFQIAQRNIADYQFGEVVVREYGGFHIDYIYGDSTGHLELSNFGELQIFDSNQMIIESISVPFYGR